MAEVARRKLAGAVGQTDAGEVAGVVRVVRQDRGPFGPSGWSTPSVPSALRRGRAVNEGSLRLDLDLARRRRLREGSDDHFYGSWQGGGKAAGGRPAATGFTGSAPGQANLLVFPTGNNARSFTAAAGPGRYYVSVAGQNNCGTSLVSNEVQVVIP